MTRALVDQMTALAKALQVTRAIVARIMVEMRRGQATRDCRILAARSR
jgi:hypothetical protein